MVAVVIRAGAAPISFPHASALIPIKLAGALRRRPPIPTVLGVEALRPAAQFLVILD
jgi:hypothetical protein